MKIEEITYQEQASFRITTSSYTAVYHREGCGFAGLWDKEGQDWIMYRPTGGEYGHYRGIPNMGFNAFGHPGYDFGATTTVNKATSDYIELLSASAAGDWQTSWEFSPERITQTITAVAAPYWWLYEGTPGGHFRPETQYALLSTGATLPCNQRYASQVNEARSVCFVDPVSKRGLKLTAHTPEPTVDVYWPMGGDGGMTVWGFGRHDDEDGVHSHLTQTPATFSIAFEEDTHLPRN